MSKNVSLGDFVLYALDSFMLKEWSIDKLSNMNEKILKKGSIQVCGDRVSLKDSSQKSVDDVIISRLDALTNNSKIDGSGDGQTIFKWDSVPAVMKSQHRASLMDESVSAKDYFLKSTLVKIVGKKKMSEEARSTDPNNIVSYLAARSNLIQIFRSGVWKKWKDVVEASKDNNLTYVLYIPRILVYLGDDGRILFNPYYVNFLMVAVPSPKHMKDGIEKTSVEEATEFIVSDTLKAACYIGSEKVYIDPTDYRYLKKNFDISIDAWKKGCGHDTYKNTVQKTYFCVPAENDYLIMKSKFSF